MISASEFVKWMAIFNVLTGHSSGGAGVQSVNDILPDNTGNVSLDSDDIPQGTQNIFATDDGGATDNLAGLPTIVGIIAYALATQNQLDDHVNDLNNPHDTSLQQAFLQNNKIQITGSTDFDITDNNDLNIQKVSQQGTQSHTPLVGLVSSEDVVLDDSLVDINFYNSTSSTANSIKLSLESPSPLFSDNSTFLAYRNGAQVFTVFAQAGVTIDSVDGNTITLSPNQIVKFIRLGINEWITVTSISSGGVSSLNGLIGALNITSPTGTISITPSGNDIQLGVEGADLACASYNIVGNTLANSYGGSTYFVLANLDSTIHNQSATNMTIYSQPGVSGYTGVRFDGLSTQQFLVSVDINQCNFSNSSGTDEEYTLSLAVGPSLTLPLGFTVISDNPMPYTLLVNAGSSYDVFRSKNLHFQAVVTLNPGDCIFVVGQSAGPGGDTRTITAYMSFSIVNLKQALASGSGSGGTLQDAYNVGDGSITVATLKPFQVLNSLGDELLSVSADDKTATLFNGAGIWTPTFTSLVGITGGITCNSSRFIKQNKNLIFSQDISFVASDSVVNFNIDLPSFIVNNFSNKYQACLCGQSFSDSTPTSADGSVLTANAVVSDIKIYISINSTIGSGVKHASYSVMVEIQ